MEALHSSIIILYSIVSLDSLHTSLKVIERLALFDCCLKTLILSTVVQLTEVQGIVKITSGRGNQFINLLE